ncbi:MAG: archaellin/type IV pilin N-terminal domain-containing protein [Candidatus Pacearchaeota archaeon]
MIKNKKGISPVVATILLISLAIILALIVLFWALGWLREQIEKNGKPIESACKDAKIKIEYEKSAAGIKIVVVNIGNLPINEIGIKEEAKDGASKIHTRTIGLSPGAATNEIEIPLPNIPNKRLSDLDKIIIYPSLIGKVKGKDEKKAYSCLSNAKIIKM